MISFDLPNADAAHRRWLTSDPFPHVLISGALWPDEAAAEIAAEYPPPDDPRWKTYHGPLEAGKQEAPAEIAGPLTADVHRLLASDDVLTWLRAVSGIPDLIADPDRLGGGIHQSGPDARLAMHVDFNVHPHRHLLRCVNVILFVGDRTWPEDVGGTLYLGAEKDVEVYPQPGALVAFQASDTSWHGHPDVMTADAPLRRSIPAYYYRPIVSGEVVDEHSTRFLVVEQGNCPHGPLVPDPVLHGRYRCSLCGGLQ